MKYINNLFNIIALLTMTFCSDGPDLLDRDYPLVQTSKVEQIDFENIYLEAQIRRYSGEILQHGFIWGYTLPLEVIDTIYLGALNNEKFLFSFNLKAKLSTDKKYFFRSFAKNQQYFVVGNQVEIECTKCSKPEPEITAVNPPIVREGQEIIITGVNLNLTFLRIYFDNLQCNLLQANDAEIRALIPIQSATQQTLKSREEKIIIRSGDGLVEAHSPNKIVLMEPWLRLENTKKFANEFQEPVTAYQDNLYFINGRSINRVNFFSRVSTGHTPPEFYNAILNVASFTKGLFVVFYKADSNVTDLWRFNFDDLSWDKVSTLPTNEFWLKFFVHGEKIFFYGNRNFEFNIDSKEWREIPLEHIDSSSRIFYVEPSTYAVSGNTIYTFNEENLGWVMLNKLPFQILYEFIQDSHCYFGGGANLYKYNLNDHSIIDLTQKVTHPVDLNSINFALSINNTGILQTSSSIWEFDPNFIKD